MDELVQDEFEELLADEGITYTSYELSDQDIYELILEFLEIDDEC